MRGSSSDLVAFAIKGLSLVVSECLMAHGMRQAYPCQLTNSNEVADGESKRHRGKIL